MFRLKFGKQTETVSICLFFFHCLARLFVCFFIYLRKKDLTSQRFSLFVCFVFVS